MSGLAEAKAAVRAAAFARRKQAFDTGDRAAGARNLLLHLRGLRGKPMAGYMPMRTEIDPLPAMAELARHGPVGVPVIQGKGQPLRFRAWTPETPMEDGPFGARVPVSGGWIDPELLIVPLVAFDRAGNRLGYGGGFYDRTLEALRSRRQTLAVGFAWAAQEAADIPVEPTDQPLDALITETEIHVFYPSPG